MRYSTKSFPPYTFIPGRTPHPTRDPEGHSYGREEPPLQGFGEHDWQDAEAYLYAVDLFNHGYWWEAHESWEACWVAAGRQSEIGYFVQGLIQIAVACLKRHQGFSDVAQRMVREGLQKFPRNRTECLGIAVQELRSAVEASFSDNTNDPALIQIRIHLPAQCMRR
jgi:hypothetical protein